jgi:UDP-GlcNAc:undecaprenyl-phosphate GlcNAc-1-phosphate transferase
MIAFSLPVPSLTNVLAFLGALSLCAWLTSRVLKYQRGVGYDQPDEHRKHHGKAISRLGGLPIFITLMFGMSYMALTRKPTEREWWPVVLCNALIFGVGFLDDLKPLGARVKLMGQIGVALILWGLGGSIDSLSHPTLHGAIDLGWWSPVVTLLWLVAVPNIINLIDGMDGLASGFGMFLCLTLAFVGHFSGMPDVVMMATIMGGALAGFLLFNFPPAKIFLGDGGAYLIGFFVASVSLHSSRKVDILGPLLVMVVAMGLPILDTAFAILRRAVRGLPVFRADAEHIHHRLISLGYSKGQALGILYSICALLSLIGIFLLTRKGQGMTLVAAALALAALGAARLLGYVKSFRGLRQQLAKAVERRRDLAFARAYGRLLELEADRLSSGAEFAELLARSLKRLDFSLNPEHARETGSIPLTASAGSWVVGRMVIDLDAERWRTRLEALLPGVERAMSRWPQLPGVQVMPPEPVATTASKNLLPQ